MSQNFAANISRNKNFLIQFVALNHVTFSYFKVLLSKKNRFMSLLKKKLKKRKNKGHRPPSPPPISKGQPLNCSKLFKAILMAIVYNFIKIQLGSHLLSRQYGVRLCLLDEPCLSARHLIQYPLKYCDIKDNVYPFYISSNFPFHLGRP